MKKKFEGMVCKEIPNDIYINPWLNSDTLQMLTYSSDTTFSVVTHADYCCTEYKMKLNLFTFRRFQLHLSMTIIGSPVSIDSVGYRGDLDKLIADYKRRRGLYLILNLPEYPILREKAAVGETLSTCLFHNCFSTFDDYLAALRGSYRRRIKQALERGACLRVEKINNLEYTEQLHDLYRQVRHNSKYPLETVGIDFFRKIEGDLYAFYDNDVPVAFIALRWFNNELNFIFGGMDYAKRNELDLHYNMLLLIVRLAIQHKAAWINFGQTAEHSKQRIGCTLSERYMVGFSGNPIANILFRIFGYAVAYRAPKEVYRCFRS